MARYKSLFFLYITLTLFTCKKEVSVDQLIITPEDVFVVMIKSDQIDINYRLSQLGYEETGVTFSTKSNSQSTTTIKAVRVDEVFKISLSALEPNTEYVLKIYHTIGNQRISDKKEYIFKTLSAQATQFKFQILDTPVNFNNDGSFLTHIVGENLNDLNLKALSIRIGNVPLSIDYPIRISGNTYKIPVRGRVNINEKYSTINGSYNDKEVIFQRVPFSFTGERYWLTYSATNLRGYHASPFNNDLYYFIDNAVQKWVAADQRLVSTGPIPPNTIVATNGTQYQDKIFFPVTSKNYWLVPELFQQEFHYPESYSFAPATQTWKTYAFKENGSEIVHMISNNQYFIHRNELYLTYSLTNDIVINQTSKPNSVIYKFDKATGEFNFVAKLSSDIIHHHFVSINDKLYLIGLVPFYDQGHKLSSTFVVFNVTEQTFKLNEIYRGGTDNQPLTFFPKNAVEYDGKILIANSVSDFLIFDPNSIELSQVFVKQSIPNTYLGGFLKYNNKLHLNADLYFSSQKVYEISIIKSR